MRAIVAVLLFWFVMAAIVTSMAFFDRLIRWLHTERRDEWITLGRPRGFLFRPEGVVFWTSDSRFKDLQILWTFVTPVWVNERAELRRALWISRGAGLCAVAGMIALGYWL
jgi:hypothetical protein